MIRNPLCAPAAIGLAGLFALSHSPLAAAGYAIAEQSLSGLGYGFAGAAAIAEDNSTIWHNPAGLTYLGDTPQFTGGVHLILPEATFKNTGTLSAVPVSATEVQFVPTQGANDTSDTGAIVPNLFYSHPVSEDLVLGFALNVPFGLATEYEEDWVGRYVAVESDLRTVNLNPTAAYRINEQWSIGFGANVVLSEAVLSNAVDFGLIGLAQIPSSALGATAADIVANRGGTKYDGFLHLEGDGVGYGFNFGVLWEPRTGTRLGLHYRSQVELELEGDADFTVGLLEPYLGGAFPDQGGTVDLTLPSTVSLSVAHEVNAALTLLADLTWTDWSVFDELAIVFETGSPPTRPIPENWGDTLRYSVGARYVVNEHFALRAGLVYDEAAVPGPEYVSPRIPDAERTWLALGGQWQVGNGWAVDVAFAHVFVADSKTNNSSHTAGNILIGENEASVTILSVGTNYRF